MSQSHWFSDLPRTIGELPSEEKKQKLRELRPTRGTQLPNSDGGRRDSAPPTRGPGRLPTLGFGNRKAWDFTGYKFGYIQFSGQASGQPFYDICSAESLSADQNLRRKPIKITLDRFRVKEYPGWGPHRILINFSSEHSVNGATHQVNFNQSIQANDNNFAAVNGIPVFKGLQVGDEGLILRCYTVNVKNQSDETFLAFLESPIVRAGLLLSQVHTGTKLLSQTALEIAKSIAKRNRNAAVQKFEVGLDFSGPEIPVRCKLRTGSYVAVQVPGNLTTWNWEKWKYSKKRQGIIEYGTDNQLPYNYLIFSISQYDNDSG